MYRGPDPFASGFGVVERFAVLRENVRLYIIQDVNNEAQDETKDNKSHYENRLSILCRRWLMPIKEDPFIWIQRWLWKQPELTLTRNKTLSLNPETQPHRIWNVDPKVVFVYPGTKTMSEYVPCVKISVYLYSCRHMREISTNDSAYRIWVIQRSFCSNYAPTLTLSFTSATNLHHFVQRSILFAQLDDLLQCDIGWVNCNLTDHLSYVGPADLSASTHQS